MTKTINGYVFSLALLVPPAFAQSVDQTAQPAAAEAAGAVPATVVIEGRRPGPGVWKVSKGTHVMWVFGTYSPLPRNMEWDASRVERLVAKSQEVLMPPVAKAHIGFFSGLTALPSLIGIKRNPDDAVLHDVVPADVYAHWTVLKAKYIGEDDGIEHYRPVFAGEELLLAGLKKSGLSYGSEVLGKIEDVAKKNKVKMTDSGYDVMVDDPRKLVRDFKNSQVADLVCFTKTLDTLDTDLETMRVRANAWANGDIAEIRGLNFAERRDACLDAVMNSSIAKDAAALRQVRQRLRTSWLKAAENALASNAATFAVLEIQDILGPTSYLAGLQARGYVVESPR
ncbi:TraB/GumN family protein [Massilia sp. CT11-137]|uniref:TraB/GumN family protein n=1 Tax=Massilia sp. CT11-137 TaxID=3393901 RepID=UPI0039A5D363